MEHLNEFIVHHWQLFLAFLIVFIIIFINEYLSLQKQGKSLSTDQAVDQINNHDAMVLDLRPLETFKKGHITGSTRATEADFNLPKLQKHKDKPIILVCAKGIEATALATKLRTQGYLNPMVLAGGIEAWLTANLPLVKK